MKYEEDFVEIKYFKSTWQNSNQIALPQVESIKKVTTYKLSL